MSEQLELAGRIRRLIATGIDALLVPSLTLVLVMVTGVVEDAQDYADDWYMLHVLLLAILSYLILNGISLWRRGQTLGKMATGVAIVGVDGSTPPPWWKLILIRAWFFPLLFLSVIPWVVILPLLDQLLIFRSDRRCIHDWLSGTKVVRRRS